jgi:hypothetical protein
MEQKQLRLKIARDMLDNANSDSNFLNAMIIGDETWVYGYDPETKMQSSQWKHPSSPRPKRALQVRSNVKVMLAAFVGWCITSTHHKAQPLPRSTTRRSFIAFVIVCDANNRTCGQRQLGSCNTIMHPPILRI